MKKIFIAISIILMTLLLTACGETDLDKTISGVNSDIDDKKDMAKENEESLKAEEESNIEETEYVFEEIVVMDNEEFTIKIIEIDEENLHGYTIYAYCENKSTDKYYGFAFDNAYINGLYAEIDREDDIFSILYPGKNHINAIRFYDNRYLGRSIREEEYTDIEFDCTVVDIDINTDPNGDFFINDHVQDYHYYYYSPEQVAKKEKVHIYPNGKSNATVFTRKRRSKDIVLLNNDHITVRAIGYDHNYELDWTGIDLFIENKTDINLDIQIRTDPTNIGMIYPGQDLIDAGKDAFRYIGWDDEDLKEQGIDELRHIEMTILVDEVSDYRDDTKDYIVEEKVILNLDELK